MKKTESELVVDGQSIRVSNLEKILYPKAGFTKAQVIDYYIRISPLLLPHLRDRALTLKRYPNGVEGEFFYEKKCPAHRPDWVATAAVWSKHNQDHIDFCLANDLRTLVWAANLADLELHTSLARAKNIDQPTLVVFDLDPGPPATIVDCCDVALLLRARLQKLGLESFPKTSGSKGLQIYIPLNTAATYELTKPFAQKLAEELKRERPELILSRMARDLRAGKVFVDWSQNDRHKTTVCVYSLRAKERPTVSTPLTWEEVTAATRHRRADKLVFDSDQLLARVKKEGDLFEPVLKLKQKIARRPRATLPTAVVRRAAISTRVKSVRSTRSHGTKRVQGKA